MRRLIVCAGANGAGKSSLRDHGTDAVEIEVDPDRIARAMSPDNPRGVDAEAGREALRLFDEALARGASLSLETTLAGRGVLGRMAAARAAGFAVELLNVALADADTHVARVEERVRRGGHWIAPDVIRRRVERGLENLPAAVALADRAALFDNSGRAHRAVLEVERRQILFRAPDPPRWLAERLPAIEAALITAG
jgi:predicted ABC-type ATPase